MGSACCSNSQSSGAEVWTNYDKVCADLRKIMDSPDWDDGSYAPLLIRLAWHSSGTYNKEDGSGGSNGATMRYTVEASDPENAGLDKARQYLEQVKQKHKGLSYADLWILAAYVAIEHTGGPSIEFIGGRVDQPEDMAIKPGRLPGAEKGLEPGWKLDSEGRFEGWEKLAKHIREEVFGRMGFNDQETVALITGGHVYGRCHTESSGYAGAWVENPTLFSNEYAADMVGDKWIAVEHDTKMPDGGPVPEEVRPRPGKRQYIDLSKYEGDAEQKAAIAAPNADQYPPGWYKCVSTWVNCREMPDTSSPIIGRLVQEQEVTMLTVKLFGTAVRGRTDRGGWVSIIASGGKTLFERTGDLDVQALSGRYRAVVDSGVPAFQQPGTEDSRGRFKVNDEFEVSEVSLNDGSLYGKVAGEVQLSCSWALLSSAKTGVLVDRIVEGWNEKPRKPIVGQTGHQMMLASDMVLLWDEGFRKHLEVYAEDEKKLKEDFGKAFKRLTELGCPWSTDVGPRSGKAATGGGAPGGCPYLAAQAS
eukprot:CAMPEP_0175193972 /NCGR_PEP_ID=MMETSP0093-20121207/6252_1 /TAXON_ID=311494 /ORGANISM="Alexandrium monilatum, Strain CCMP3105" /LENGTH=530 /DNA_ID=CAMNT_0016486881 /DNA_START=80 /DNA_END=1672 /DNA_ORIENTATION=-